MKASIFLSTMLFLGGLTVASSCSEGIAGTDETTTTESAAVDGLKSATVTAAAPCVLTGTITDVTIPACVVSGTVTDAESTGLLFMREEEKMARDVYTYMYAKYKLPVFLNISKSENIHTSAVLRLITGFKITDNSSNNAGEYTNSHLIELYNQLIAMGNLSVNDALKVGVLIEQTDIADLQKELLTVTNTSIKTVYTNLMAASNAHLKAFSWNLKIRGVVYP